MLEHLASSDNQQERIRIHELFKSSLKLVLSQGYDEMIAEDAHEVVMEEVDLIMENKGGDLLEKFCRSDISNYIVMFLRFEKQKKKR